MLSLERYAIVRAAIEKSGDRDRSLAAADILPREWLLVERRWHRELAAEVAKGRRELSARYLAAFEAALGPPADAAAKAPVAMHAAAAVRAPEPAVTPALAPARAMPSYLANPAAAAVAAPRVATQSPAMQPAMAPAMTPAMAPAMTPAMVPAMTPAMVPAMTPAMVPAMTPASPTTGTLDDARLKRPATPFAPAPVRAQSPYGASPSPAAVERPVSTGSQATSPAKPAAMTAFLDTAQPTRAPTPFVAAASDSRAPIAPSGSAPPSPASPGTGTAIADEELEAVAPPQVPPELPSLTVDQYAWVTATLKRTKPDALEATLTRLRLTPASRVALDAVWKAHMARHPAAKQAFILALGKHLSPP